MEERIEIFFCYAREDESLRQELEKQLRVLQRQGLIDLWHDREISAGAEWEREIDIHLIAADIILLLVSSDFITSDYCYGIEMKRAMERHERGEACVIPVILRPVFWQKTPFGKLQALPTDGIPVTDHFWHHLDSAFFNVAEGIRKEAERLQSRKATRQFHMILESGNLEQIVATYDQNHDRIKITDGEQVQVTLARQFVQAYRNDNDDALIAAYNKVAALDYHGLFTFTSQQLSRVALAHRAQRRIEQLWYTWSTRGFGFTTGYQIRAASQGLQDTRSGRVQDLGRYLHYQLPIGINTYDIPLEMAPISLGFIHTKPGERILVNRVYAGRDGAGRPGAFFCHLLAGLPDEFSPKDAIALWRSSLWQTSDASLNLQSSTLPTLSLQELDNLQRPLGERFLQGQTKLQHHLPSLIQAYLTRREQRQIYIVAPADEVASLIFGLVLSLPQKLLANLTFSTYEYDATTAKEQIVGTCWLNPPTAPISTSYTLPSFCYENGIVINSYTEKVYELEDNPDARSFALYATECLLQNQSSLFRFLKEVSDLNVEAFLSAFHRMLASADESHTSAGES